jgi:glycolate oxidase FAD binding subunit
VAAQVPRGEGTAERAATLRAELATALGADALLAGDGCLGYQVDGVVPRLVAMPGRAEEVAAALAVADRLGAAVIPWGGGSAMALGYPPRAFDLALDLRRLNGVLQYEPADLTLSVQAGITFAALREVLDARGQRLPLDCSQPQVATLGGLVAANLSGPRRLRYGTARDLLIGVRAAHPDGTLSRGGGMVVKNVSGYDMMKLYLGSLGTLGVVVELNFKLAPRPPSQGTIVLAFAGVEPALEAAAELLGTQLLPCAVVVLDAQVAAALRIQAAAGALAVCFEGTQAATERQLLNVRARGDAWGIAASYTLWDRNSAAFWERVSSFQALDADPVNGALLKLSVVPTDLGAAMSSVVELCGQVDLGCLQFADAGSGIVYVRVGQPADHPPAVFAWALWALQTELVRRWGQSVVLSCPTVAKENLPLWGREPSGLAVMHALKERFDPRGILNPGRFVDRI